MPHHDDISLSGTVRNVFAHRFTLEAGGEVHLADLTPKGLEAFPLRAGLAVALEGERRPSEIKVTRIVTDGSEPVSIEHKKPRHGPGHAHPDVPADPELVLRAVRAAGWKVAGDPRRKPNHFEVLGAQDGGPWTELHVDFAGAIHKQKPADAAKWALPA